jgi:hypothetical protein
MGDSDLLFPVSPTLESRASMKQFLSLQFLNSKRVGKNPWTGDQPVPRPLPTQENTNRINAHRTSMPRVGFEPTIPVSWSPEQRHKLLAVSSTLERSKGNTRRKATPGPPGLGLRVRLRISLLQKHLLQNITTDADGKEQNDHLS